VEDARRAQKLNASRQAPRPAPTPEEMRRRADEQCARRPPHLPSYTLWGAAAYAAPALLSQHAHCSAELSCARARPQGTDALRISNCWGEESADARQQPGRHASTH